MCIITLVWSTVRHVPQHLGQVGSLECTHSAPPVWLHCAGAELNVHVKCTSINYGCTMLCGEKGGARRVPDHGHCPVIRKTNKQKPSERAMGDGGG